eukprot:6455481-Amphidinium_carterae.1
MEEKMDASMHLIDSSCSPQQLVSLSTGESEFYAVVRGTACGLQTQHLLEQMEVKGKLTIPFDSSSARGFCQKIGVSKRMKQNVTDIGTKYLGGQRVVELVRLLPVRNAALAAAAIGASAENVTAALAASACEANVVKTEPAGRLSELQVEMLSFVFGIVMAMVTMIIVNKLYTDEQTGTQTYRRECPGGAK